MRADGRGVDLPEDLLTFDRDTLTLTMSGRGGRGRVTADSAATGLVPEVVTVVTANPGLNQTGVCGHFKVKKKTVTDALFKAVCEGLIYSEIGPSNSKLYFPGTRPDRAQEGGGGA